MVRLMTLVSVLALALSGPAFAGPGDKGKGLGAIGKGKGVQAERMNDRANDDDNDASVAAAAAAAAGAATVLFGDDETKVIRDYFERNDRVQTASLPPGIAKNVARGKRVPPGIAKNDLPGDLASRLPVREGYERILVDEDVVLVEKGTQVIVDIIENVLGG